MSENPRAVDDEDLPVDLQPSDDNPLARSLDPEEAKPAEELDLQGGKVPEQLEEPQEGDDQDASTEA